MKTTLFTFSQYNRLLLVHSLVVRLQLNGTSRNLGVTTVASRYFIVVVYTTASTVHITASCSMHTAEAESVSPADSSFGPCLEYVRWNHAC